MTIIQEIQNRLDCGADVPSEMIYKMIDEYRKIHHSLCNSNEALERANKTINDQRVHLEAASARIIRADSNFTELKMALSRECEAVRFHVESKEALAKSHAKVTTDLGALLNSALNMSSGKVTVHILNALAALEDEEIEHAIEHAKEHAIECSKEQHEASRAANTLSQEP